MTDLTKAVIETLQNTKTKNRPFQITVNDVNFQVHATTLSIRLRADLRSDDRGFGSDLSIHHDSAYETYNDGDGEFDVQMYSATMSSDSRNTGIAFIEASFKNNKINDMILNFWKDIIESKECKVAIEHFFKRMETVESEATEAN